MTENRKSEIFILWKFNESFKTNTMRSTSTTISSTISTIFAGGYSRCNETSKSQGGSSSSQKYRLSEYHYSNLAGSQSLDQFPGDKPPEIYATLPEKPKRPLRNCLSVPDFAQLFNCDNCQGNYFILIFSNLRCRLSTLYLKKSF